MAQILLADDDQSTRDLVKRALEVDGHSILLAVDGNEALETIIAKVGITALVSDVNMPGLDGIELVARAIQQRPDLKVLLMSGYAEQFDRARELKPAKLALLTKPFSLDQMRTAVRELLG